MLKKIVSILLCCCLFFTACQSTGETATAKTKIVATTYPVYLFTMHVVRGIPDIEVNLMVQDQISCLHDYSLSTSDMNLIEKADILILNGGGLEGFMDSALKTHSGPVVDSSAGISLLTFPNGEIDPHIWMDPNRAMTQVSNIAEALSDLIPEYAGNFKQNADTYCAELSDFTVLLSSSLEELDCRYIISFHDGFAYFAQAFDLEILKSIEEEAGSEASAQDITEIIQLIRQYDLPAIFTEVNGSAATAEAIARETGVSIYSLDLIMSGKQIEDYLYDPYMAAMAENVETILEALHYAT